MKSQIVLKEIIPNDRSAWPHPQETCSAQRINANKQTDRVGFNSTMLQ